MEEKLQITKRPRGSAQKDLGQQEVSVERRI
jgi:hypothetical protein